MPRKVPQDLQVLDLEKALSAFSADPQKLEVLKRAVLAHQELALIPDEELVQTDTTHQSRVLYVASLLRLLAFIKLPSESVDVQEAQAKLAMAYVRHAESSQLTVLQIGRTAGDKSLLKDVEDLRAKVTQIAETRAKLLAQKDETEERIQDSGQA